MASPGRPARLPGRYGLPEKSSQSSLQGLEKPLIRSRQSSLHSLNSNSSVASSLNKPLPPSPPILKTPPIQTTFPNRPISCASSFRPQDDIIDAYLEPEIPSLPPTPEPRIVTQEIVLPPRGHGIAVGPPTSRSLTIPEVLLPAGGYVKNSRYATSDSILPLREVGQTARSQFKRQFSDHPTITSSRNSPSLPIQSPDDHVPSRPLTPVTPLHALPQLAPETYQKTNPGPSFQPVIHHQTTKHGGEQVHILEASSDVSPQPSPPHWSRSSSSPANPQTGGRRLRMSELAAAYRGTIPPGPFTPVVPSENVLSMPIELSPVSMSPTTPTERNGRTKNFSHTRPHRAPTPEQNITEQQATYSQHLQESTRTKSPYVPLSPPPSRSPGLPISSKRSYSPQRSSANHMFPTAPLSPVSSGFHLPLPPTRTSQLPTNQEYTIISETSRPLSQFSETSPDTPRLTPSLTSIRKLAKKAIYRERASTEEKEAKQIIATAELKYPAMASARTVSSASSSEHAFSNFHEKNEDPGSRDSSLPPLQTRTISVQTIFPPTYAWTPINSVTPGPYVHPSQSSPVLTRIASVPEDSPLSPLPPPSPLISPASVPVSPFPGPEPMNSFQSHTTHTSLQSSNSRPSPLPLTGTPPSPHPPRPPGPKRGRSKPIAVPVTPYQMYGPKAWTMEEEARRKTKKTLHKRRPSSLFSRGSGPRSPSLSDGAVPLLSPRSPRVLVFESEDAGEKSGSEYFGRTGKTGAEGARLWGRMEMEVEAGAGEEVESKGWFGRRKGGKVGRVSRDEKWREEVKRKIVVLGNPGMSGMERARDEGHGGWI